MKNPKKMFLFSYYVVVLAIGVIDSAVTVGMHDYNNDKFRKVDTGAARQERQNLVLDTIPVPEIWV